MRFALCIVVLFWSFNVLSQTDNSATNALKALKLETNNRLEGGINGNIEKSTKEVSGSYHLFKGWNNQGIIHAKNGKSYKIRNVNFNVKNNYFEYKNEKDSIIGFDLNGAAIVINSKKFKSFYFKKTNDNKIFEIIHESDSFILLKDYSSEVKVIKPEGYRDFSKDEYVVRKSYFLISNNKIERFKLNKRNILDLLNNDSGALEVYVKKNKLSYKKDKDLKRIISFYNM